MMGEMERLLEEISKTTSLKIYERDLRNILGAIKTTSDFWRIVDISEEPLPLVSDVIFNLEKKGYIKIRNGIYFTDKGLELVKNNNISEIVDTSCKSCKGRGVSLEDFKDILNRFEEITKNRPAPKQEFDQAFVTPDTVIARLSFMVSRNDIKNKEIFIIGDDDLTSVALMLSDLPKRIAVVDIDKRLTDFIEELSRDIGYNSIDILTFDIRNNLPDYIRNRFDTFITDPPETLYAIKAFVGRGISSLKSPGGAGYFGLTRRESSLDKWREIEKLLLNEFRVVITDITKNFNEYVNWGYEEKTRAWKLTPIKIKPSYNWYESYMIRIQTLENSRGFERKIEVDKELYDDEESSTT